MDKILTEKEKVPFDEYEHHYCEGHYDVGTEGNKSSGNSCLCKNDCMKQNSDRYDRIYKCAYVRMCMEGEDCTYPIL